MSLAAGGWIGVEGGGQIRLVGAKAAMLGHDLLDELGVALDIAADVEEAAGGEEIVDEIKKWQAEEAFGVMLAFPPGIGVENVDHRDLAAQLELRQRPAGVIVADPQVGNGLFLNALHDHPAEIALDLEAEKAPVRISRRPSQHEFAGAEADFDFQPTLVLMQKNIEQRPFLGADIHQSKVRLAFGDGLPTDLIGPPPRVAADQPAALVVTLIV